MQITLTTEINTIKYLTMETPINITVQVQTLSGKRIPLDVFLKGYDQAVQTERKKKLKAYQFISELRMWNKFKKVK